MDHLLNDGPLLRRLMKCPDRGGTRHTVRSLAAATGLSKSKIHRMLNDQAPRVASQQAEATAEAVGVRCTALFTPISTMSMDMVTTERTPPT